MTDKAFKHIGSINYYESESGSVMIEIEFQHGYESCSPASECILHDFNEITRYNTHEEEPKKSEMH